MTDDPQKAVPTPDPIEDDETSIAEYLVILLDEWRTLVVPFILVILAAGAYLIMVVPQYSSSGVLQVSSSDSAGASALLELSGMGRPSPVETEVEILRSKYIIGMAAHKLGLGITQKIPDFTFDVGVTLGGKSPLDKDLRALRRVIENCYVDDWVERNLEATFTAIRGGGFDVVVSGDAPVTVPVGGRFDKRGVHFSVGKGKGLAPGTEIAVTIVPDDKLANDIIERISVESIGGRKETNLVRISLMHQDRTLARDLINEIMDVYMGFAIRWRTKRADLSATFIENQLESIRLGLESAENDLQVFLEKSGGVMLPEQAKELISGGAELELELRKVRIQEDLFSSVVNEITRARKNGGPVALTGDFLFDDELLGQAIGALNELELKREALLSDMTATHPEVVRLNEEIRRVRVQVLKLVRASRDRIKERRQGIGRALDEIQVELSSYPDKERQMASLKRKMEVSQELYTFLMTKLEEANILKASTTTDKRIIDPATTPFKKSKPRRLTTMILAAFLGLIVGMGAVFLRRAVDPRIRDEEEAKNMAGLSSYGVIPNLKDLGLVVDKDPLIAEIWGAPKGPAAESFRTLRTNVEFSQVEGKPIQVIQITSSEASEGKSTVISNLAIALSKAGQRVVVVDLDLRRPVQHRMWGVPRSPGISDYLVGRTKNPTRHIEQWNVDVIPAGNEPPESQRLLSSDALADIIAQWRDTYDYVLLDTPPLLVADSLVISRFSDMMLFVVRPRVCRRAALKLAGQTHRKMDLVKGMVINGVTTRRGGYYHYYRGSYYGSRTTDTQES